jgi:hypothetical protein
MKFIMLFTEIFIQFEEYQKKEERGDLPLLWIVWSGAAS